MLLFPSAAVSLTRLKLVPAEIGRASCRERVYVADICPGKVTISLVIEPAMTVNDELAGPLVVPSLTVIVVVSSFTSGVRNTVAYGDCSTFVSSADLGLPAGPL